ncbi:MAG: glycosyl transferase, partial [Spirochaetota bacterium]
MKLLQRVFNHAYNFYIFNILSDKAYIKRHFKQAHGYDINLSKPRTLNEKIHWLKLYDRTRMHTQCADKLKVREFVSSVVGEKYLIPIYYVTS